MQDFLFSVEENLFYLINNGCQNPFFDVIMPVMTRLGSGAILFFVSIAMIFLQKKEKKRIGVVLLAGLTVTYYVVSFLKEVTARPRPYLVFPDVHVLIKEVSFSFPSFHTTDAFMAAMILSTFFKWHWIFFGLAALVGFSRVYVGVHYVSDVLAGALIGMLIGYVLVKVFRLNYY